MVTMRAAEAARSKISQALRGNDNVVSVGIAKNGRGYVVRVGVLSPQDGIPARLGHVPVVTEIADRPRPRARGLADTAERPRPRARTAAG